MKKVDNIAEVMRFIYSHFLSDNETVTDFMKSRTDTRPRIRHVVRNTIYRRFSCTLKEISLAEQKLKGKKTHHSTIIHSKNIVREQSLDFRTFRIVDELIDEFELYNEYLKDPVFLERLQKNMNHKHHVLAIILTIAEYSGYSDTELIDQLSVQFKLVSPAFIRQKLKNQP